MMLMQKFLTTVVLHTLNVLKTNKNIKKKKKGVVNESDF